MHPVLFQTAAIAELISRPARYTNLREFITSRRRQHVEVADPGILMDIDTQEDYQNALRLLSGSVVGQEILAQSCRNHVSPLFIDEIGPLELGGQGFRDIFVSLIREEVELYVVVRKSCLDRVIAELVKSVI